MLSCINPVIDDAATSKATPKETILSLIAANSKVTVAEIADVIGTNKRNAQNHINKLVEEGLIVRIGAHRGGHCEIIKKQEK